MPTQLATAKELAAVLCLSESTILEQAQRGAIPHYRIGRSVRFDIQAVLAAAQEGDTDGYPLAEGQ